MKSPLLHSLLLSKNTIDSSELAELNATKHSILSVYNSSKKWCNLLTLLAGIVVILTVSPVSNNVFFGALEPAIPFISFTAFCVVNASFFVKWRLTVNYKRVCAAEKQNETHLSENSNTSKAHHSNHQSAA